MLLFQAFSQILWLFAQLLADRPRFKQLQQQHDEKYKNILDSVLTTGSLAVAGHEDDGGGAAQGEGTTESVAEQDTTALKRFD